MRTFRYISDDNSTASFGLAADEYLMDYASENHSIPGCLRLYTYDNYAVLAGRFQDIRAEIDIEACREKNYTYGRRLTGGGAILMGSDQLGVCFSCSPDVFRWENVRELYTLFSRPLIHALAEMGIHAELRAKNDLEVNGRKIAGLGVHISPQGAIQFHASLLMDLDIHKMLEVLKIPIQKYSDKQKVNSVEQRMTTLTRELGNRFPTNELRELVKKHYQAEFECFFEEKDYSLEEIERIRSLENSRYLDEEWIFQRSPQADMTGMSLTKTRAGLLRTYIGLKGETIKSVLITGDYFDNSHVMNHIEASLKWSPVDRENIAKAVEKAFNAYGQELFEYQLDKDMITRSIWIAAQKAYAANRYTYNGSCYYPKAESDGAEELVNQNEIRAL